EPYMSDYLKAVVEQEKLRATTNLNDGIMNSEITFISVPTPQTDDGSPDLSYIEKAAKDIGSVLMGKKYHVIVVKSTVVPGTMENIVIPELEKSSGKKAGRDFGVCVNPEFLREGKALEDFLKPDRIIIGSSDRKAGDVVEKLYGNFNSPVLQTDLKTAEMIKYASNALLAAKISFSNDIGNVCKQLGIDVYDVMNGVGMDSRISPKFLQAGAGFGGSCFPKDVAAIVAKGKRIGQKPELLEAVLNVNKNQRQRVVDLLDKRAGGLNGKRVAVLGLAFKPDSDDTRGSPAIDVIAMLKDRGASVSAYDPKAIDNMRRIHSDIDYCESAVECLKRVDACIILTGWEEFKGLSDKDFDLMRNRIIIEGRKVLNPENVKGFEGLCWPGNMKSDKDK
ncbi:unnamed protein product, partial [marine sediment metagenome]